MPSLVGGCGARKLALVAMLVLVFAAVISPVAGGVCGIEVDDDGRPIDAGWIKLLNELGIENGLKQYVEKTEGLKAKLADAYDPAAEERPEFQSKKDETALYTGIRDFLRAKFDGEMLYASSKNRVDRIKKLYALIKLEKFAEELGLDGDVDIDAYLGRVVQCHATNKYLNHFMMAMDRGDWVVESATTQQMVADLRAKDKANPRAIPKAVLYSVVLDRLTRAARSDGKLFKLLNAALKRDRTNPLFLSGWSYFERIKAVSVDMGIDTYIGYMENGVDTKSGTNGIPLNIIEATWQDYIWKNVDNSKAGWALTMEHPGQEEAATKARLTSLSEDGIATLFYPPEPKLWGDLYATWNMAFVSNFRKAPMYYAKLVNPQVACYAATPEEYLFNRGVALQIHLHWMMASRRKDRQTKKPLEIIEEKREKTKDDMGIYGPEEVGGLNWKNEEFTKLWGRQNNACAQRFNIQLRKDRNRPAATAVPAAGKSPDEFDPMTGFTSYHLVSRKYFQSNTKFFRFAFGYQRSSDSVTTFLRKAIAKKAKKAGEDPDAMNERDKRLSKALVQKQDMHERGGVDAHGAVF